MKTYLYSIPNKIQSFSKKLDVKASLCGKSWDVYNDEGVKQLFIFNEDGSLLITNNGKVSNVSWQFIPQNSSILIISEDETIMFRPAFYNKDIFALQQDGVERYLLMIDEEKKSLFPNLSLNTLADYIEKEIEAAAIDADENIRKLKIEKQREDDERTKQLQIEKKEEEKQLILGYIRKHKEEINRKLAKQKRIGKIGAILSCLLIFPACFIHSMVFKWYTILFLIVSLLVFLALSVATPMAFINRQIEGGIRYHSDDEVSKMCDDNESGI